MWASGVYEKVTSTLLQGRLRTGWLHTGYTYNVLLVIIGLPGAIALATLIGNWFGKEFFENTFLPQLSGFIFVFSVAL